MKLTEARALFPALQEYRYFSSSVQAPLSTVVAEEMQRLIREMQDHVCLRESEWIQRLREIRTLAARLIGCDAGEIAFIKNTAEGVNFIAEGFLFKPGDNIVGIVGEYPANIYPWMNQRHRDVEFRLVPTGACGRVLPEDLFARCDARTKVIAISHVEYASGFRNNLKTIGAFCQEHNIFFFVDPIQSLGALQFKAKEWGVDALAADGRKWMLGPPAAGLFYINKKHLDRIRTTKVGAMSVVNALDYGNYNFTLRSDSRRFEAGDPNWIGLYGLGKSLEMLLEIGIETIQEHIFSLADSFLARLPRDDFELYSSVEAEERSGILSILPLKEELQALCERLYAKKIVAYPREGRLRIALHLFNNQDDLEYLLEHLQP